MMKLLLVLLLIGSTLAYSNSSSSNIICQLCEDGLNLLQSQLDVLEKLTSTNLGNLVDDLCSLAPRKIPIVNTLCTVLRDDLVDALIRLVKGLKSQTQPKVLCGYLVIC